jgi:hypothetical protein
LFSFFLFMHTHFVRCCFDIFYRRLL